MDRPHPARRAAPAALLRLVRRADPILAVLGALLTVAVAGYGLDLSGTPTQRIVFWVLMGAVHLTFATTAWRVSRITAAGRATRRLWTICAAAGVLYLIGDGVQLVVTVHDPYDPVVVIGTDVQVGLVAAGTLALMAGLLTCPVGVTLPGARSRLRLDVATVMAAATTGGLYVATWPERSASGAWLLELASTLLIEPGVFLVAVFAVVRLVLGARPPFSRMAGIVCGSAAALQTIAQVAPSSAYLENREGSLLLGVNIVASTLLAMGGRIQQIQVSRDPSGASRPARRPYSTLPYAAVAAAYALMFYALATTGLSGRTWTVIVGVAVSTLLVTARQLAAFRHIAELLRERDLLADRLTQLAFHDNLTGLANRALFMSQLTEALTGGCPHGGRLAVALIDLDDFKPVNDRYGHAAGDELLRRVGGWLGEAVRAGDTVARLGGDEFAVLARDLPTGEGEILAARIHAALHRSTTIGTAVIQARGSVGMAYARPGTSSADELLHDADLAMYRAKRQYKVQGEGGKDGRKGLAAEVHAGRNR